MSSKLRVEEVAIGSLVHDPNNARKHSERQIKAIATSLSEFGQQRPLVVGPGEIVYAGNGTLEAARSLGWDKISIIKLPFDDPIKCRAFSIADNRTSDLAEWDNEELLNSLKEISSADLLDAVGYMNSEIDDLKALLEEVETEAGQSNIWYGTDMATLTDKYADRAQRQIVLIFPNNQFVWVVERLQALREDNGMESNGEAVIQLLAAHFNEKAPQ
jgi:ParB-like chromosome segregation protein Spo0J